MKINGIDKITNQTGVYIIFNNKNDCVYIGSSKEPRRRILNHIASLNRGNHWIKRLQSHWSKLGKESFFAEILEFSDIYTMRRLEQSYLDSYKAKGKILYNYSDSVLFQEWSEFSAETRAKLSKIRRNPNLIQSNNTTGYKGVNTDKTGRFFAKIKRYGTQYNLDRFDTKEEAFEQYKFVCALSDNDFTEWWLATCEERKNKKRWGDNSANPKLSEKQIEEIYVKHYENGIYQRILAEEYKVTQSAISRALSNYKLRH